MLSPGQILEGKYRIEKKLDQGGMGCVYRVQHLGLQKPFALKTLAQLSSDLDEQARFAQQFALEAKTLAELDHPGLTRVVDFFHDDKTSYLVMELVEGVTLTSMVADSMHPMTQDTVQKLAAQALEVLDYLHRRDPPIIVRDIKPDNLMITSQGRLKLIDFGLAKRMLAGGKTQAIVQGMGSDDYSPMEQYGQGVTDQRSDLFSLGATLYYALTGQPPPAAWKRVSMQEPLLHPAQLNPTVSDKFWAGLKSLLEIDMKSRPASVGQARKALILEPAEKSTAAAPLVVPHSGQHRLASAAPYFPFQPGDWILKAMQAATRAQAREARIVQNRTMCKISLAIPAQSLPDAGEVLQALSAEQPAAGPDWLRELACGLKMVGEFRDFRLTLDNWSRAWCVQARGGSLEATQSATQGRAGLVLEVDYTGKGVDRARQAADEMVALARRTRMCPFPLYVDDRRLASERPVERASFAAGVREVYLASVSIPSDGHLVQQAGHRDGLSQEDAWTVFAPHDGLPSDCQLDLRCFLEPSEVGGVSSPLSHFAFLRQPLRLLWYRHGVLCGQQEVGPSRTLEVMAHCQGNGLPSDASGLRVTPVDLMFPGQLKPLVALAKILPVISAELEGYQPPKPAGSSSLGKAAAGLVAAPLLILLFGAAAGPIVLKSALAGGLLSKAAAFGGVAGYLHHDREEEALRGACLKALAAYEPK